jgi:MFS family permease
VILPVVLATVVTGLIIAFAGDLDFIPMIALAVVHGALMIPIYSLCLAHVNDSAPPERFVQVSGGLLLIYSAGAAIGPLAAAPMMERYGPGGLFMFISALLALFGTVTICRMLVVRRLTRAYPGHYTPVPRTTQSIYEMEDPQ